MMLVGIDKKRKQEEEEADSRFSRRSEASEVDERGVCIPESYKDVDIVSELRDCSTKVTTTAMDSLDSEIKSDCRFNEVALSNSRVRFQDDQSVDCDSASVLSVPFASISKPAPSKWDDAEKWIASPQSNRLKTGQSQGLAFAARKIGQVGFGNRQSGTRVALEVADQKMVAMEEVDTKLIDPSQGKKEGGGRKFVNWVPDTYPILESDLKPALIIENSVAASASAVSLSQHDSSVDVIGATTFIAPPSTVRSVSMRDMGTEMTPITSQEPSRTGTPVRATPTRSPSSSKPSAPGRSAPTSTFVGISGCQADPDKKELSEKELQMKTRREIMVLGTQLGKLNIAAWASKEEEDSDASTSLKTVGVDQPPKTAIETCSAAWEEAEKAKYMARYKREEMKIQAWENHQKSKTEAGMRKIEVEVERMRAHAHDALMNKLAAARHKAEEKRATAEAKRNKQAAKTEQQADYIKRTGHIPTSCFCWNWCS
ncbi:hypothetical protein AAC387_Pa04g2193 [Persea americana]